MFNNLLRMIAVICMSSLMLVGCAETNKMAAQNASDKTAAQVPLNTQNVTLTNLKMNNQGNEIVIKPGKTVEASINYSYHCSNCYKSLNNQIIVGLARRSAQVCIYDNGPAGEGIANFTLKVPAKPGIYDVRFRGLQAPDCKSALKAGWNADNSPSKETTIGTIKVSRKADA